MVPPDLGEPVEVGVGGNQGAAVLHRDRRVLSIGNQLPRGTRFSAQPLENLQVIWAGTYNPGRWPLNKR